jgi:rubrerythrin
MRTETPAPAAGIRELFCSGCGYGIVAREELPECPMCRVQDWRDRSGGARWN